MKISSEMAPTMPTAVLRMLATSWGTVEALKGFCNLTGPLSGCAPEDGLGELAGGGWQALVVAEVNWQVLPPEQSASVEHVGGKTQAPLPNCSWQIWPKLQSASFVQLAAWATSVNDVSASQIMRANNGRRGYRIAYFETALMIRLRMA